MAIDNSKPGAQTPVTQEQVAHALELRAGGMHWEAVGNAMGLTPNRIRYASDPEWAKMRRERTAERKRVENAVLAGYPPHFADRRIPTEEIDAVLATIPRDTRSLQARLMGDPLPGRSALDRRAGAPC